MFVFQEGRTALIWAAMNGHTEVVKALIEGRADVEAKEKVRSRCCVSRLGAKYQIPLAICGLIADHLVVVLFLACKTY
jgi:ankyrin repeat protein